MLLIERTMSGQSATFATIANAVAGVAAMSFATRFEWNCPLDRLRREMITRIAPAGSMTTVKGQKNDFSAAMMECPPVPPPLAVGKADAHPIGAVGTIEDEQTNRHGSLHEPSQ
ncbi:MAG: hypothetical protein ACXWJS_05115 [Hyphomicrobium sp.]